MDILGIFSEDDDQEIVEFLNYQHRQHCIYTIRMRVDHMTLWDDHDFRIRFRILKVVVLQVLENINDQITSSMDR